MSREGRWEEKEDIVAGKKRDVEGKAKVKAR